MVEIEYLAWAFESRDRDAERWLRSDKDDQHDFFKPQSFGPQHKEGFAAKIRATIAKWVGIWSRRLAFFIAVTLPFLNCCYPTCSAMWGRLGSHGRLVAGNIERSAYPSARQSDVRQISRMEAERHTRRSVAAMIRWLRFICKLDRRSMHGKHAGA
jgi:hypothetical protein